MRYEISELDTLSVGKVVAVVYAAGGLVMWLFVPVFWIMPMSGGGEEMFAKSFVTLFVVAAPLFNAIFGFLIGLLAGFVYNVMARTIGGLRLTLRQEP